MTAKDSKAKPDAKTQLAAAKVSDAKTQVAELTGADTAAASPHHSFLSRLYTGTGAFEVVGRRRLWYGVSGAMVAIALLSILLRGFTFGIDFKGGTTVSMPTAGATGNVQTAQVQDVFHKALGHDAEAVVIVGSGSSASVQIRSEHLDNEQTAKLKTALFDAFQPKDKDGKPSKQAISDSAVSGTWGAQITKKALFALVVFLALVTLYITVRYERYMAISALTTMVFDLTVTAGVYSLVGFEVSPATVIGLLTILGFSLYDTVIVFDKVEENTHGFQHTTRRTFAEQANLAINQTFMRSINTSLISVLPVLSLMVVAVWLLGVGTLKDLALVQLVGILVGTYSSIFFATPLLVTLRERTDLVRTHSRRVVRRRNPGAAATKESAEKTEKAEKAEKAEKPEPADDDSADETTEAATQPATQVAPEATRPAPSSKPAPGARPVRPTGTRRPTGKRNAGRR
ncbi:protein translocase subunit SecF [Mycobacterium sp.]|uniref:protein translocase subunit SecF n=1 Tax=Mycobacterium sp. TaxID=1785 RepID=UPI002C78924E|nr:protein translocase subunit SecF [Mycobacterium sp.]HTQ20869.1 protein translocase subunit SecF [Mycobacterium sp.]